MIRAALVALAVVSAPSLVSAQGLDLSKGGPIDVTAQGGMEWRQNEQMVVASGDARAVRGNVTVTADRLIARYRRKAAANDPAAPATGPSDTGSNEVYRLEAEGHVRIFTATDLAVGDRGIYDIDQAVLLLTGGALSITTPQQVITARDAMEYWSQKRMAVARGDATVTTTDGRRVSADVLVGYTATPAGAPQAGSVQAASAAGKPSGSPVDASGKLERVEGFGDVQIRTATETVKGDRGVYVADAGIARLAGNVRITRGQNQLQGDEAIVNLKTGISTLVREPGKRVQGLVVPTEIDKGGRTPAGANDSGGASSTPGSKQ